MPLRGTVDDSLLEEGAGHIGIASEPGRATRESVGHGVGGELTVTQPRVADIGRHIGFPIDNHPAERLDVSSSRPEHPV